MVTYSRVEIRQACACPVCGAAIGYPCTHVGRKSARANRLGVNHHDRMHHAQLLLNAGREPEPVLIEDDRW